VSRPGQRRDAQQRRHCAVVAAARQEIIVRIVLATYVNAPGRRGVGRQEIADSHRRIFSSVFKHTCLGQRYPVRLDPITPEVVLVHAGGAVLFAGEDEEKVPPNGLLTMVAAERGGRWHFISFSNTPTGEGRNVRFFWRFLVSRFATFRAEAGKARGYMLEQKRRNI
jgi:uncharacterized protein (TIGR02246 family)